MRWRIRNSPFVLWKEPKSLEGVSKIAERMELYARKVKPEGKDGFESKLKDLVEPFNLFQFHCDSQSRLLQATSNYIKKLYTPRVFFFYYENNTITFLVFSSHYSLLLSSITLLISY